MSKLLITIICFIVFSCTANTTELKLKEINNDDIKNILLKEVKTKKSALEHNEIIESLTFQKDLKNIKCYSNTESYLILADCEKNDIEIKNHYKKRIDIVKSFKNEKFRFYFQQIVYNKINWYILSTEYIPDYSYTYEIYSWKGKGIVAGFSISSNSIDKLEDVIAFIYEKCGK